MTEQTNPLTRQEPPASPTLKPGHRYLSIIAHVCGENARRLEDWKRNVVGGSQAPVSTHVTVYLAELTERLVAALASERAREALTLPHFEARWGAVRSFRPVTAVEYLHLEEGSASFERAHRALTEVLGPGAAPFPYVPHVTLGHGLSEAQVQKAREIFDALPARERTFVVERLHVYLSEGNSWEQIGILPLY